MVSINQNLAQPWDLEKLSQKAGLSKTHLQRLCKQHYGCTPMHLLMQQRLKEAATQLRTSTLPIKQIAFQTGFCNPHHFSSAFKKFYSCSPSEYRQST